jgi:hypothetical protein
MSNIAIAHAKAQQASVHAVVTRANGTVEDLGMIAYYHRNPLRRWIVNVFIGIKRTFLNVKRFLFG